MPENDAAHVGFFGARLCMANSQGKPAGGLPRPGAWPWAVGALAVAALALWLKQPNPPGAPDAQPRVNPTKTSKSLQPAAGSWPEQPPVPSSLVKAQRAMTAAEQAEATYQHALVLIQRGQSHDAAGVLATALRLRPEHLGGRQAAVALAMERGELARAEALLEEGLAFHRAEPWFPKSLGRMLLERGDFDRAAEVLQTGLEWAGQDGEYRGLTGQALAQAGRHKEAVERYRQALGLHPARGDWWIGLGLSLEQLEQRDEALAAFRQARQTRLKPHQASLVGQKLAEPASPKPATVLE